MSRIDLGNRLPRILIIDDEQVVLESCVEILLDRPYDVATAADGNDVLDLLREFQPDLVFVDLKMPGPSGLEVLDTINRVDPTIVTIVITGYATMATAIEAMQSGAYDFIPKPFTPDQFRLVIGRGLEKRALVLETIALRREKELLSENFAAIVSHELKEPLSAVQQNLFVLSQQLSLVATDDQRQRLERMKSRVGDLLAIVDTWLRGVTVDLSEIRARFKIVSLSSPIANAVESIGPQAARKGVEVVVDVHGETAYGDGATLTAAFTNIIGNAVKYSHEGGIVRVAAKELNGRMRVDISDSGVGIPEVEQSHIFDDFYRADTGGFSQSGAGLGLSLSRRIIDAHNGSVSVESKVGRGTTVTILLPVEGPTPSDPDFESIQDARGFAQGGSDGS